nr:immunoglobulin light chain junction region [Macaca mulatta]
CQQGYTYPYRF